MEIFCGKGADWSGVAWCGRVRQGEVWHGKVRCGRAR